MLRNCKVALTPKGNAIKFVCTGSGTYIKLWKKISTNIVRLRLHIRSSYPLRNNELWIKTEEILAIASEFVGLLSVYNKNYLCKLVSVEDVFSLRMPELPEGLRYYCGIKIVIISISNADCS